ncbi:hypothetical protein DMN91_003480, partial [Ooceraea biroi]
DLRRFSFRVGCSEQLDRDRNARCVAICEARAVARGRAGDNTSAGTRVTRQWRIERDRGVRYLAAPLAKFATSSASVFTAVVYASASVNARLVRAIEGCVARQARLEIASRQIARPAEANDSDSTNSSSSSSVGGGGDGGGGGGQAASDTARFMVLVYPAEKTAEHVHVRAVASVIMRCQSAILTCHESPVVLA